MSVSYGLYHYIKTGNPALINEALHNCKVGFVWLITFGKINLHNSDKK